MGLTSLFKTLRLAALSAFWLLIALAAAHAGKTPPPTEFAVDGPNVTIRGVRYANPGKPPIVLFHGLVENSRIYREFGSYLHGLGYDVWMPNFRGHGKGSHRSTVKNYTKGMYGFEHMVVEDVPLMVEHVLAATGQAPHLGGHSMGGMAIKEYAAGVHRAPSGKLARSDELARTRAAKRFGKLILMGSPPHMKELPAWPSAVSHMTKPVTARVRANVPLVGRERAPTEADPRGVLSWLRDKTLSVFDPFLHWVIPKGVLDATNLTREEMKGLREKSLSAPHTDILDDFGYWTKSKKFVSRDGFVYEAERKIYAPTLYVAGDADELAGAGAMREEARSLPAEATARVEVIRETSHVDLVAGDRAAKRVAPVIHGWIENPSQDGPLGGEEAPAAEKCVSIRDRVRRIFR